MKYTTTLMLNGGKVEVEYSASRGYAATMWEPGCDDEVEITKVLYEGVDVSFLISPDDWEKLEIEILTDKDDEY